MQDKKIAKAWSDLQGAYKNMESCMAGYAPQPSEAQMAGGEMPAKMNMPTQEDGAEPGSYEGKGMMADGSYDKKKMLMASLSKKGY